MNDGFVFLSSVFYDYAFEMNKQLTKPEKSLLNYAEIRLCYYVKVCRRENQRFLRNLKLKYTVGKMLSVYFGPTVAFVKLHSQTVL